MSDQIKLPGWGHLDFSFRWLDWRSWLLHGVLWAFLLLYAVFKVVTYVVGFRWLRGEKVFNG